MKINFKILLLAVIFNFLNAQANDTWQKVYQKAQDHMVQIEFYEEIESTESISNGSKIKRSLSGVVVNKNGLIMTSSSIYKAGLDFSGAMTFGSQKPPKDITILLESGEKIKATFVGKDDDKKIAFIKANETANLQSFSFKEDYMPNIGDRLFVVYQLDEIYNHQIVVLEQRINSILINPIKKILTEIYDSKSITFALVFNESADAIGVIYGSDQSNRFGYGYQVEHKALSEIYLAESFIPLIKNPPRFSAKETSRKKWLGVNMQPFTEKIANYYKAEGVKGILINTILENSPAEKAGLKIGDVLVEFNGQELVAEKNTDLQIFRNLVREFNGEKVKVKVWRNGAVQTINIELADTPISQSLAKEVSNERMGFSVKELTKDIILAKQLAFDINGVWVSRIERASWGDLAGLQVGDLILKVNNIDLVNLDHMNSFFKEFEEKQPDYVSLFVKRNNETRFLFVKTNFKN